MIDLSKLDPSDAERIAYAEGFTGVATLYARLSDAEHLNSAHEDEIEKLKERLPVRFFIVDYDLEEGPDIVEVDERDFLSADGAIKYERHTMFQNGFDQICLTKGFD